MMNLPLPTTTLRINRRNQNQNSNNHDRRRLLCNKCWPPSRIRWTPDLIVQVASNLLVIAGTLVALGFAIEAVKDVSTEYIILTVFIVGGTIFGGGCLLALINVSWMSRRPMQRVSPIQVICNVVLVLIVSYLEMLFWHYKSIAFPILFGVGMPMMIMINLPSCFRKQIPITGEGETVCLEQDACDDMSIVERLDETQQSEETAQRDLGAITSVEDLVVRIIADDHEESTANEQESTSNTSSEDEGLEV